MRSIFKPGLALVLSSLFGCAVTVVGTGPRYPNLDRAREALDQAQGHIRAAAQAHAATGALGGHGEQAEQAMQAAQMELNEAMAFADTHALPGAPGFVTAKPPLTSMPDDARYPNLGDARLQVEWALRHIEDAMQYHAPIGTLGGHGERAVEHCQRALREITASERFVDTHPPAPVAYVPPPPAAQPVYVAPPPTPGVQPVAMAGPRYPNLVQAREALRLADGHMRAAQQNHAGRGGLGGFGQGAAQAIEGAQFEVGQAMAFADTHMLPGAPGMVTPKPGLVARPDDARYPNLGDARLQVEWAMRHIEDAMQYHAPIGTLGGHGERAVESCRRALAAISESERWADTHRR
jgi:hypothetical protein